MTFKFCGKTINQEKLSDIVELVSIFNNLSREELANTICELFSWKRPTGKLKTVECRKFLEQLDYKGIIKLPPLKIHADRGSKNKIKENILTKTPNAISKNLNEVSPISLEKLNTKDQRELWYNYIDRYHYLGYQKPFGAQIRYFIKSKSNQILGCMQFSSPGWKMDHRDKWIGWNDEQRRCNLQKIINNSRYLILPYVTIKNLASSALALAVKTVPADWNKTYGYYPVLVETLVDSKQFKGTCYKAANWINIGTTTGRGRMDKNHKCHGNAPKNIYVYPLNSRFRQELQSVCQLKNN